MSTDPSINRLNVTEKKIAIARNFVLLIFLGFVLIVALGAGAYYGFKAYSTYNDEKIAMAAKKKAEERIQKINKELRTVRDIGAIADFGDIQITLLEKKNLDTLPAEQYGTKNSKGGISLYNEPVRDVVGLRFNVENTSPSEQTWGRMMGWLVTDDNLRQTIDPYPFNSEYLPRVGENYTFDNRDLLIEPGQKKSGWMVIEVDSSIAKPIFAYPATKDLVGYWAIR